MDTLDPAAIVGAHIDGLLHLVTLSFAMTLAYLGLDKIAVGDRSREHLERQLTKKESEIGAFFANHERISNDGSVNELREYVGIWKTRKAVCMLLTLAKIPHDIYDGFMGPALKHWHAFQLFFALHCYLRHWDLVVVRVAAFISGGAFFLLTFATTFRVRMEKEVVVGIFVAGVATIVFVILTSWHAAAATSALDTKYKRWTATYQAWADGLGMKFLKASEKLLKKSVTPAP